MYSVKGHKSELEKFYKKLENYDKDPKNHKDRADYSAYIEFMTKNIKSTLINSNKSKFNVEILDAPIQA